MSSIAVNLGCKHQRDIHHYTTVAPIGANKAGQIVRLHAVESKAPAKLHFAHIGMYHVRISVLITNPAQFGNITAMFMDGAHKVRMTAQGPDTALQYHTRVYSWKVQCFAAEQLVDLRLVNEAAIEIVNVMVEYLDC